MEPDVCTVIKLVVKNLCLSLKTETGEVIAPLVWVERNAHFIGQVETDFWYSSYSLRTSTLLFITLVIEVEVSLYFWKVQCLPVQMKLDLFIVVVIDLWIVKTLDYCH